MGGPGEQDRLSDSHVRLWTVLGGIAAVVTIPLSVVLAFGVTGDDDQPDPEPAATGATSISSGAAPDGAVGPSGTAVTGDPDPGTGGPNGPILHEGEITLRSGSGADLEAAEVSEKRVTGPNGDIDLHYDVAAGLRANGGDIYDDRGPQQEALSRCRLAVSEDLDGRPGAGLYGSGAQFCFRTSQGRIGWVRVNDLHGVYVDQVVVLNFRVWSAD